MAARKSVKELAFISMLCQSIFSKVSGLYTLTCCFGRLIRLTHKQNVAMLKKSFALIETSIRRKKLWQSYKSFSKL